jgi:hypothetical protein
MFIERGDMLERGDIPEECIEDCTHQGDCTEDVELWLTALNFNVDVEAGFDYLKSCGLDMEHFIDDIGEINENEVNLFCLWIACGNIKDNDIFVLGD